MNQQELELIKIYENLRKEAQINLIRSGTENLSFDELEWRVVNNPDTNSRDLIITVNVCGKYEILTIPFKSIEKDLRFETNIARVRIVRTHIEEYLAKFIANKITDKLNYAARELLNAK